MANDRLPGLGDAKPPLATVADLERAASLSVPAVAVARTFMTHVGGFGVRIAFAEQLGNDASTLRPRAAVMMSLENFEDMCRAGLRLVQHLRGQQN